jgi:DNA-binding GntR family transcriptional regulator
MVSRAVSQKVALEAREADYDGALAKKFQRSSLSKQVSEHLFQLMIHGVLKPGDKVNELALAKSLGVSRNPIREAIRKLEQKGILVTEPGRGAFVRELNDKDINEIGELRLLVETTALRRSLKKINQQVVEELRHIVAEMERAAQDGLAERLVEFDFDFHAKIVSLAGNSRFDRVFRDVFDEMRVVVALLDLQSDPIRNGARDHIPILEAIEARDVRTATRALEAHIRQSWGRLSEIYQQTTANDPAAAAESLGATSLVRS